MKRIVKVDFHVHSRASRDSLTDGEKLYRRARELGLGKLILTDHNTISGALELQKAHPDDVIVGEEILTTKGEILAFFVQEELPEGIDPLEALQRLKAQGAFISLAHPYAMSRHGWTEAEMEKMLPYLDAIEAYNARNFPRENRAAVRFALNHRLCFTAGSDSHGLSELGAMGLELPDFRTPEELRTALQSARVFGKESPLHVRWYSRRAVLWKKLKAVQKCFRGKGEDALHRQKQTGL